MKKAIILLVIHLIYSNCFAQPKYDKIDEFGIYKNNWALVHKNGKVGFIDGTGKEIVKPIYTMILDFSDYKSGWALVRKNNLVGFIDSSGKEIVKPVYTQIDLFGDYKSGWAKVTQNDKVGFIDTLGKEVVKPIYDKIEGFGNIKEDWAIVKKNKKLGIINFVGKEVLTTDYDAIFDFDNEICRCAKVKKRTSISYIDEKGNSIETHESDKKPSKKEFYLEQRFVDKLNQILLTTPHMDWKFEGKMKIDSMFSVNENGMLSVTLRYIKDSSFYKVRMEAPLNKIHSIDQDIYIILLFKEKDVKLYISDISNETLVYRENINMFHIGEPADGAEQSLLKELQNLYSSIRLIEDNGRVK